MTRTFKNRALLVGRKYRLVQKRYGYEIERKDGKCLLGVTRWRSLRDEDSRCDVLYDLGSALAKRRKRARRTK